MLLFSLIAVSLRILSSPFKISDPGGLPRGKFVEKRCNVLKLVISLIRRARKKEWKEKIGEERKEEREERERRKRKKFQVRSDCLLCCFDATESPSPLCPVSFVCHSFPSVSREDSTRLQLFGDGF